MDRLVWPTAKVHLYLWEVAHVKEKIGRERIRRNKELFRELRCYQEILADLHERELCSAPPERRGEVEAAASRWQSLRAVAAERGTTPHQLCEVPRNVERFLRAWSAANPGRDSSVNPWCGSQASSSTRAPSTGVPSTCDNGAGFPAAALEGDAASNASGTDCCRAEATYGSADLAASAVLRSVGSRLSKADLDALALRLGEQLEQEHTSLMTSIEEVQALMEAEVAGAAPAPSPAELAAFAAAADAVVPAPLSKVAQACSPAKPRDVGAVDLRQEVADVPQASSSSFAVIVSHSSPSSSQTQRSQLPALPAWSLAEEDAQSRCAGEGAGAQVDHAIQLHAAMLAGGGEVDDTQDVVTSESVSPMAATASISDVGSVEPNIPVAGAGAGEQFECHSGVAFLETVEEEALDLAAPAYAAPPRRSWADIASEEDEESVLPAPAVVGLRRRTWADIASEEDEESVLPAHAVAAPPRRSWADIASEEEEEEESVLPVPAVAGLRRRPWADIASEEDEGESVLPAPAVAAPRRRLWADLASETEEGSQEEDVGGEEPRPAHSESSGPGQTHNPGPLRAQCIACQRSLLRSCFSRRAWTEARRASTASSSGDAPSARGKCTACSAADQQSVDLAVGSLRRPPLNAWYRGNQVGRARRDAAQQPADSSARSRGRRRS